MSDEDFDAAKVSLGKRNRAAHCWGRSVSAWEWEKFYEPRRVLPSGELAGVCDMLTTAALIVGLDATGYRTRFCYEYRTDAERALQAWDGVGDPPGPWIKEKPSDRLGPGARLA